MVGSPASLLDCQSVANAGMPTCGMSALVLCAELTSPHGLFRRLPTGSHVILMGLADGRVLYESLHARIHPVGQLRGDVTYADVYSPHFAHICSGTRPRLLRDSCTSTPGLCRYSWLNCLSISPCRGWMNTNRCGHAPL